MARKANMWTGDGVARMEAREALRARISEFGLFDLLKGSKKGGSGKGNPYHAPAGSSGGGRFTTGPKGGGGSGEGEAAKSGGSPSYAPGGFGEAWLKPAADAIAKKTKEADDAAAAAEVAAGVEKVRAGKAKYAAAVAAWTGRRDAAAGAYNAQYSAWQGRKAAYDAGAGAGVEKAIAATFVPLQAKANALENNVKRMDADLSKMGAGGANFDKLYAEYNSLDAQNKTLLTQLGKALPGCSSATPTYSVIDVSSSIRSCIEDGIAAYRAAHPVAPFGEPVPVNEFTEAAPVCNESEYPGCTGIDIPIPPGGLAPGLVGPDALVSGIAGDVSATTRALINEGLAAIAAVHGVQGGKGEKVSVDSTTSLGTSDAGETHGTFSPGRNEIYVKDGGGSPTPIVFVHEYGHYLEAQQLTDPEQRNAISALEPLWAASPTVKKLAASGSEFASYALDTRELWARSYAQWIALRSGNKTMKSEIELYRDGFGQWSDGEFGPIADQMDKIFAINRLKR